MLLLKVLQTQPQVKNMNIKYYDSYYTVTKNRDEKEIVNDEYENNAVECMIILKILLLLIIILEEKIIK